MAENLSIKKSPEKCVLECPLCLQQLTLPQTLQQCLHSYCKSCLDKVPQKTQDGRQGWLCPMCENFSQCDQIQQNTFIEQLQKFHNEPEHCNKINCEQCSDDCGEATWKCAECKIGLCESAKIAHLRIPMLKGHNVVPLDSDGERVIDNVLFCKVHEDIPVQLHCRDCAQLICYKCNITDHEHHKAETVEEALERILPETENSVRQVEENIGIIEAQIEGVKKEIEQTRESFACCRMQIDDHLEKVICQIRAMKAQMEEDVNEQESIALDTLKEIKQQLEKQLSQASIINNLTAVVTTKTRHTSQLQQLQTGLFEKIKAASASKKENLNFQLPDTKFIEGHRIKEELSNIFGDLGFDLKENNINISGELWTDDDFMCHDFEQIVDHNFIKIFEIDTVNTWCNRLSHIDNKLWLPLNYSTVKVYNRDGKLEKTIDTGGKRITVVRKANNGDFICAGCNGLYITNQSFTEWTMLSEGEFSDVVVLQRSFFALEFGSKYIHHYNLTVDGLWKNIHKHNLVADGQIEYELDSNSTLIFSSNHFWVTMFTKLYKLSYTGKYLHMWEKGNVDGVDPTLCGVDKKGEVLIADYMGNKIYLLDTKVKDEIAIEKIWQSLTIKSVRDAVFDSNNDLWTLSGNRSEGIKLTKFIQNRKN